MVGMSSQVDRAVVRDGDDRGGNPFRRFLPARGGAPSRPCGYSRSTAGLRASMGKSLPTGTGGARRPCRRNSRKLARTSRRGSGASSMARPWRGVWPVVPTVFTETGELDLEGQRRVHRLHGGPGIGRAVHPRQLFRAIPAFRRGTRDRRPDSASSMSRAACR